ncbi:MAG: Asp-tRNA(Asn)/Glu-tRNA(Gln) amidotransferase subunit GatC [Clostridiales bacterium]|nr:Asp-tRNA(Asn)/Glu-tRNA(Gln) amidotransferase subunit GatC [Clostridiales bacterium]
MAITKKEIEHVARLARLDSSGGIFDSLSSDMQSIVAMVDKLQELDLSAISDTVDLTRVNALREDEVQESSPREKILKNAPSKESGGISVPKIVE